MKSGKLIFVKNNGASETIKECLPYPLLQYFKRIFQKDANYQKSKGALKIVYNEPEKKEVKTDDYSDYLRTN
jgi:hypothetical protein